MSDQWLAEVERVIRVGVRVDIAKHCAYYAKERAEFNGTDEEFVKAGIDEMAYELLHDSGGPEDDGIEVMPEWDEVEVTNLGGV